MKCTECPEYRECVKHSNLAIKRKICPKAKVEKQLTNADRIRSMSDEELAEFLVSKTVYQESAWSEPSYLNFLTGKDDTKSNAIADTIKWLQQLED